MRIISKIVDLLILVFFLAVCIFTLIGLWETLTFPQLDIVDKIVVVFFEMGLLMVGSAFLIAHVSNIFGYGIKIGTCKKLNDEELELVKDAKDLIRKVDERIVIADFNVYKCSFLKSDGLFRYDKATKELNVFIAFKRLLRSGKDFCFSVVLHEILHSQNLKNYSMIFDKDFLEGLNQFFTVWLINNYSQKYQVPEVVWIARLGFRRFAVRVKYNVYDKYVNAVEDIFNSAGIDTKEAYLKYIDLDEEFFRSFVPKEYFKNAS